MATSPPTSSSAESAPQQPPAPPSTLWDQMLSELRLPSEDQGPSINLLDIPLPRQAPPPPPSVEPQTAATSSRASRAPRGSSSSRSQKRPAPQVLVRGAHGKFSKRTTKSTNAKQQEETLKTMGTTPTRACNQAATEEAEALTDSTSSVLVVQPPPTAPIEFTPPTPTELADCIITYAIFPYLHFHSHTVLEYESRRQLVLMHYRAQLIAFIDSEMRKVPSDSYKTLDLIVSKCARVLE